MRMDGVENGQDGPLLASYIRLQSPPLIAPALPARSDPLDTTPAYKEPTRSRYAVDTRSRYEQEP
ncbi:hypothetical protein PUN4_700104 [Paraburkholderia unamae]|nr:hypothetical protein PUN4_700104 [Paraburkholderia unamae]